MPQPANPNGPSSLTGPCAWRPLTTAADSLPDPMTAPLTVSTPQRAPCSGDTPPPERTATWCRTMASESPWAVRSSVAVDNGVAYFASGIFPHDGIYLTAVTATNGARAWQTFHLNQGSFQGYMLLSPTRVYCPGGRSCPWYFDRNTGGLLGQYQDANALGTFALLAGNSLFFGPSAR